MAVLTGTVVDSSDKKPVADVVVTATSPSAQGEQMVVTDSAGLYRIPALAVGKYTIRARKRDVQAVLRATASSCAPTPRSASTSSCCPRSH